MNPVRWLLVFALGTMVTAAAVAQAPAPACTQAKKTHVQLVPKTYPVADLLPDPSVGGAELLVDFVMQSLKPKCWKGQGGRGTIEYCARTKSMLVKQTPQMQEQVACLLKALERLQAKQEAAPPAPLPSGMIGILGAACGGHGVEQATCAPPPPPPPVSVCGPPGTMVCPAAWIKEGSGCSAPPCPACKATTPCKQYGHFVMENVTVNAMGVSAKVKRIRFMYKGDGIDGDVAKCALTDGESEKKVDSGKLDTLIEKLGELVPKKEASSCLPPPPVGCLIGAVTGAAIASAPLTAAASSVPCPAACPKAPQSMPCTAPAAPAAIAVPATTSAATPATTPAAPKHVECEEEDD